MKKLFTFITLASFAFMPLAEGRTLTDLRNGWEGRELPSVCRVYPKVKSPQWFSIWVPKKKVKVPNFIVGITDVDLDLHDYAAIGLKLKAVLVITNPKEEISQVYIPGLLFDKDDTNLFSFVVAENSGGTSLIDRMLRAERVDLYYGFT